MSFSSVILTNAAVIAAVVFLLWIISVVKADSSIVDPFWGVGFVIIAWVTTYQIGGLDLRSAVLATLVTIWGLRLSIYLGWRNFGESEDRRYAQMRDKHGKRFWWVSLFTVFLLQGALMWFISLTFQLGMHEGGTSLSWIAWLGIFVWCVGFYFESVGDYQMARFKARADSQGSVMSEGLWRYTRHPNYFGDFCVWWGIYLVSASTNSWWTIASPMMMSFLLMKVSGVTLLEGDIEERRPEYAAYKKRTNAFFPGPANPSFEL